MSVESLLAHQAWVRALAHSLVRDPATADDLAQEAMLAALRSPPRHEAAIRSWFRRVLRSRLLNHFRSHSRRVSREAAVARPEGASSLDESFARVERHKELVDLVLALRSPFRETVVLRFFDDLTPKKIGERLGVPASTVRSRLTRAMTMLRDRLDDEHGGDRKAWQLALLPLLLPRPTLASVGKTALVSGGTILMATKSKVLIASLVLVVLAVAIGTLIGDVGPRPASPSPEPSTPEVLRALELAAGTAVDTPEETPGASPEEVMAETRRSVRVRVSLPDGAPAVGADVRLVETVEHDDDLDVFAYVTDGEARRPVAPPREGYAAEPVSEAVADANGEARLVPAGSGEVRVRARRGNLAAASKFLRPDRGETKLVTLSLGPALDLHGRVVGPDDRPIAGARVKLRIGGPSQDFDETLTDRAGRYSFPGFPMNADWISVQLTAAATGYAERGRSFDRRDRRLPTDGSVDLILAEGIEVIGRCVDERGVPLEGIAVADLVADAKKLTGPAGRFRLRGLDSSRSLIDFFSRSHGHMRVAVGVTHDRSIDIGDVTLVTGGDISGQVVGWNGEALPDAAVELREQEYSLVVRKGRTDQTGRFRFTNVGTEPVDLVVHGPTSGGSWASGITSGAKGVEPGTGPLRITLAGERSLLVRLKQPGDAPTVQFEKVLVRIEPLSGSGRPKTQAFVGGDTNSVRLEFDEAGPYRVTVWVPGCEYVVFETVEILPDRPTEITAELQIGGPRGDQAERGR